MEKEHFFMAGEGGHIRIVQNGDKYARVSDESALADLLDDDENINFNSLKIYDSLEEAFAQSSVGMLEYALRMVERGNMYARFSEEGLAIAKKMVCKPNKD